MLFHSIMWHRVPRLRCCWPWHSICVEKKDAAIGHVVKICERGQTMPDYKQRKIEVTPKRQPNGTWQCPYRIIEFHSTCWKFHTGSPDGCFATQDLAVSAALTEAKQIVDSLERLAPSAHPSTMGLLYRNNFRRLTAVLSRSQALIRSSTIVAWSAFVRRESKPT